MYVYIRMLLLFTFHTNWIFIQLTCILIIFYFYLCTLLQNLRVSLVLVSTDTFCFQTALQFYFTLQQQVVILYYVLYYHAIDSVALCTVHSGNSQVSVLPWYYMYNSVRRVSNKEHRGNTKRGKERRREAKRGEAV